MNENKYLITKYACYTTNVAMAAVGILSPLLFVTFRELYGISYTLLGLLVVVNFTTQLAVDLIFTFLSSRFNIRRTILIMPLLTIIGLVIYAVMPMLLPRLTYLWLVIGTIIFSSSAGLNEVLISPVIAAIPSDNPERDMSKLHSSYAWGLVAVVIIGTVFLKLFGVENWFYLALIYAILPLIAFLGFVFSPIPKLNQNGENGGKNKKLFNCGLIMCFFCIFLGGAAEGTMTQWISSYIESAFSLSKIVGDILGMALFAAALGLGRTLYSKFGKNIINFMILGMASSLVCYIIAGLSTNPYIGLIACVLTGFCVSMLWPGNIILVGEKFPTVGVAAYALMAAGGDMGSSVAPQLMGIVSDAVSLSNIGVEISELLKITPEQLGMRCGLLVSAVFPLVGLCLIIVIKMYFRKKEEK